MNHTTIVVEITINVTHPEAKSLLTNLKKPKFFLKRIMERVSASKVEQTGGEISGAINGDLSHTTHIIKLIAE